MKQICEHERALLNAAHKVLETSHQLMLPHHQNIIGPRLETFEEMQIHEINATGINKGRFKTNIILLTRVGQRASITREMSLQDTVIIDLSEQEPDIDKMRQFLTTTELCRKWHHAPWLVINMMKKRTLGFL